MKIKNVIIAGTMALSSVLPTTVVKANETILPTPKDLQSTYSYYDVLSDEFNGNESDIWLMDYMPWWSDTAEREQSGTKTRYRFIDADGKDNQSLQIYVNGENHMGAANFQPYYLEKLSGPQNLDAKDRYLAQTTQKNNWNSKFAGFMAGGKDYLNTFRGSEAPIENHAKYSDAGATTYGYFETRVKFLSMKRGQGLAPAFWFIGMQDDVYDLGEVDVFEFLDNYTLDFTIHPKGDPNISKVTKQFKFKEDMSKDYHTYGVLWDETGFSLYVDGEFLFKHNQKINYRMIPMFSINHHENGWIGSVDNAGHPEERTMDIDYFRVFKKDGTDPEPNKLPVPEMKPGNNVADGAYISLYGLTGKEVDKTPVQWLNDKKTNNMVLSGICDRMGDPMEKSTLPQYLYIDWRMPATFDTIILHAQNAKSTAPTLVDVEVSEDGETWKTIKSDIRLDWKTDTQIAESKTIKLDEIEKENLFARIKIKEANLNAQGKFGLCEVEIGEDIEPMAPEYMPLPEGVDMNMKDSLFSKWNMEDSPSSTTNGLDLRSTDSELVYVDGKDGKALQVDGRQQHIYAPLVVGDKQLKCDEDFTLGMWINPSKTSLPGSSGQIILAQQTGSQGGRPWLFLYNNTLGTFLGNTNTFGKIPLKVNEWQYVAVTFRVIDKDSQKGEVALYVNGQLDTKAFITYEADSLGNPELLLGRHKNNTGGFYEGAMDSITLLNKTLQPQDIEALYKANGRLEEAKGETYDLSNIVTLPKIEGNVGELSLENLGLPEEVTAVFDDVYAQSVEVNWDVKELESIDFNKDGSYTVHGIVDLSAYPQTTNTKNIKAEQRIEINAPVNLTGLADVLQRINETEESKYTEESFKDFLTAVQAAQTKETQLIIGEYPNYSAPEEAPAYATQEIVDGITNDLNAAFDLLVEIEQPEKVDKAALISVIEKAKAIDVSKYTEESVRFMKEELNYAESILNDEKATQKEVNDAEKRLNTAINQLVEINQPEIVDKAELKKIIDSVKGIDTTKYTLETAKSFITALDNANKVLANENATQEEVDKATTNLINAYKNLELNKEDNLSKPEKEDGSEKEDNNENKESNKKEDVKTGVTNPLGILFTTAGISLAGAVILIRKKKNNIIS